MSKFKVGDRVRYSSGERGEVAWMDDEWVLVYQDTTCRTPRLWCLNLTKVEKTVSSPIIAAPESSTLRDQFAMSALTGLLSDTNTTEEIEGDDPYKFFSEVAYEYADAMLRAREEKQG